MLEPCRRADELYILEQEAKDRREEEEALARERLAAEKERMQKAVDEAKVCPAAPDAPAIARCASAASLAS